MTYTICKKCKNIFANLTLPSVCKICDSLLNDNTVKQKEDYNLSEKDKLKFEKTKKKLLSLEKKALREAKREKRALKKEEREKNQKLKEEKKKKNQLIESILIKEKKIKLGNSDYKFSIYSNLPDELKIDTNFSDKYIVTLGESGGEETVCLFKKFDEKNNVIIQNAGGAIYTVTLDEVRKFVQGIDSNKNLKEIELIIEKFGSVINACRFEQTKKKKK